MTKSGNWPPTYLFFTRSYWMTPCRWITWHSLPYWPTLQQSCTKVPFEKIMSTDKHLSFRLSPILNTIFFLWKHSPPPPPLTDGIFETSFTPYLLISLIWINTKFENDFSILVPNSVYTVIGLDLFKTHHYVYTVQNIMTMICSVMCSSLKLVS